MPYDLESLRRQWLTGLIREVHVASCDTYGSRPVHAEFELGVGITVCDRTVWALMNDLTRLTERLQCERHRADLRIHGDGRRNLCTKRALVGC